MPVRLRVLPPHELAHLLASIEATEESGGQARADDVRAVVKHYLAVLTERSPGKSVEVRIPPYAAVQCVEGARHTRGTPPAVVEMDGPTWIGLARGTETFAAARTAGRVRASGERSDLTTLLPLT